MTPSEEREPTTSDPTKAPTVEFTPRFRHQLFECLIGAPILAGILVLGLRYLKGADSTIFLVSVGLASGLGFLGLYMLRFKLAAPRRVRLDEGGIFIEHPKQDLTLRWDAVVRARHRAHNGLRWECFTNEEDQKPALFLRDDGFSVTDWDAIGGRIQRELESRGIAIGMDAFGSTFREE